MISRKQKRERERERERERSQLCMLGGLTKREDLEGRLAGGGWQLEARWDRGNSL
jgi:hypothetical protein